MPSLPLGQHAHSLAAGLARLDSRAEISSARVSSGRRLDRPATDSPALGQVAKLEGDQGRLRAAEINIQNGVSQLQATTGQLGTIGRVLSRLSELAVLSQNPTQSQEQSALYASESGELQAQLRLIIGGSVAEIGGTTDVDAPSGSFNGRPLFGPGPAPALAIGADTADTYQLPVLNLRAGALGRIINQDADGNFTFALDANAVATLKDAVAQVSGAQAQVGAGQSRLNFAANVAATAAANREAALSTLQDTDLAAEVTAQARYKFLTESHTSMLAQARDATAKLLPLLSRS